MDCMDTRVAIVTGGARGIGAAITTTLARAGYHVAAGYSTNQAAAEWFTGKLIADGLSLSVHKGNVGEPGDCLRVTGEVLSLHGRVDVLVNYAASKSGLSGLTKSLALETARKGITVNCVAPGYTDTDMIAAVPGNVLERYVSRIPVGRLGRPEEVARVVRFLAEDDASYITGAVIPVNGGLEM